VSAPVIGGPEQPVLDLVERGSGSSVI